MPHVSVIMPAYNAAQFIGYAYRSLADQTLTDWELIVVNDGSQDDTLAVTSSLASADPRIKIVDLPVNSGPAHARNLALAIAQGDWIALLDADDTYSRDRLEVLIGAGERNGADIVLDNLSVIDPISKHVAFLAFEPPKDDVTPLQFSDFLRNTQSNTFFDFGYLKPIVRRGWLMVNGLEYQEQLRLGEDLMFLFECYACHAKVVLVSKPYYHYTFQYSHITRTKSPTTRTTATCEPLLSATERFLERRRSEQTPLENRLLASAIEALRETLVAAALRDCLRRRDIIGIVSGLRHPIRLFRGVYYAKRRNFLIENRAATA
jgi:succinoglycan biosynthesis protein ExoO